MRRDVNYALVAQRQRGLLVLVLIVVVSNLGMLFGTSLLGRQGPAMTVTFGGIYLLAMLAALVMSILLMAAEGKHPLLIVLLALLMFVPLVGLLVLLHINSEATMLLRFRGVKVGLLGAPKSEWGKLQAGHCRGCGYDRSGIELLSPCPECGRVPEIA